MFAAEWWRWNYAGGGWEWAPIFETIGQKSLNTEQKRSELVRQGCAYWQRKIFQHDDGPNSYLGTLFFESGLPVRLLTNQGYVRALLINSFAFFEKHRISREDTLELVRDQARSLQLPEVLKVNPFFGLIYEVVTVLLALKKEHTLGRQEQPLIFLNEHVPHWRETLPVRLDDGPNGGAFVDELLLDVARMVRQESSKISVAYILMTEPQGWKITTVLSIPDGNHPPENLQLDPETFAGFSGKVRISISCDGVERLLGYGFKTGSNQLSIRGLSKVDLSVSDPAIHYKPWAVVFADSQTEEHLRVSLSHSDGLSDDLPWVFSPQTETTALLKGVGSVRLSATQAWVVCPASFTVDSPNQVLANRGGHSETQVIYELDSTVLFRDTDDDQTFRVRLSAQHDDDYYFALRPRRNANPIRVCCQQNANIFVGFPVLCKIHKAGEWLVRCTDALEYKTASLASWQKITAPDSLVGRFRVRLMSNDGEVLFSREIAVLPATFSISFNTATQSILLANTATLQASAQDEGLGIGLHIERENTGYRIGIPTGYPAHTLKIRLSTPATKPVDLHVPSLTTASYFTDSVGKLIAHNQLVDFQGLYGARLVLNNVSAQGLNRRVVLTLVDHHNPAVSGLSRTKTVKLDPFSNAGISLIKYKGDIERLLSFTDTIDATVRIQPEGGSSLQVTQFLYHTAYSHPDQLITLKQSDVTLPPVPMQAFSLDVRFHPDLLIDLNTRETGWTFPDNGETDGKWFYFSGRDSTVSLRPSVAKRYVDLETNTRETVDELHEASHHSFGNRQTMLTSLFDQIGCEFSNVNWSTLQHLHTCTQHLPLNALDIWKALVKTDRGLVAFFLLFDPVTIGKVSREFSVNWHRIAVADWIAGFRAYQATLPAPMTDLILRPKLQELEAGFSLGSLTQIIQVTLLGGVSGPQFQICQHLFFIQPVINQEILGELGSPGLIQRHDGHQFPTYLSQKLIGGFNRLPESVRELMPDIPTHFQRIRSVAYLPVLLAYQSVHPDESDLSGLNRHQVTQLIDLDEPYFNLVYNLIQAFCWLNLTPKHLPHGH